MYKRLIEYEEIGIDKPKREKKELDLAVSRFKEAVYKNELVDATRSLNILYEHINKLKR